MLNKILENIGLNEKEASVYLAALEIGSNPVSKIAAKAKINRVTAYDIIEKLNKKGLMSSFTRARVKYFTATDPEKIVKDFQRKVGELSEALPDFQRLSGDTVHPRVRYFEGLDGIRHIYEDTLASKTEILNYGASEEIRKNWPTYDIDYVAKRAEKGIFLRGITLDDEHGKQVVSDNTDYNREIRLLPKSEFDFSNEIHIYDNKVAIISFKDELIGMIIESPEITNTQRAIFKMVWEFSKKQTGTELKNEAWSSEPTPEFAPTPEPEPETIPEPAAPIPEPVIEPEPTIEPEREHKAISTPEPTPQPEPEPVPEQQPAKPFDNQEQSQLF